MKRSRLSGIDVAIALSMAGASTAAFGQLEWTNVGAGGLPPVDGTAMAYDVARGVPVLHGGAAGLPCSPRTWEYYGQNWNEVSIAGPWVVWHTMVFDAANQGVLLFGNHCRGGPSPPDATWLWDGVVWTMLATNTPGSRGFAAMAYDTARSRAVLFGGWSDPVTFVDTWEWDGSGWALVSTTGPAPRVSHAMAYDRQRGVTVLFGGADASGQQLDDTWEWNGQTWTERQVAGPGPRSGHALVCHAGRGTAVLFGGVSNDTWEWDGDSWTQLPILGPPWRRGHGMAYDEARGVIVMAGGDFFDDTWELTGAACPACACDWDGDPACTFFDFLFFQNEFVAANPCACGFDGDPACSFFDFLFFQNQFVTGCP